MALGGSNVYVTQDTLTGAPSPAMAVSDGSAKLAGEAGIGSADLSHNTGGLAGGLDYQFAPDLLAGFALGGSSSNFSVSDRITSGHLEGAHFCGYGVKTWCPHYAAGSLVFSRFPHTESPGAVAYGPID